MKILILSTHGVPLKNEMCAVVCNGYLNLYNTNNDKIQHICLATVESIATNQRGT